MFFECLVVRIISNRNPKKEFLLGFDTSYTDFKGSSHLYCLRVNKLSGLNFQELSSNVTIN